MTEHTEIAGELADLVAHAVAALSLCAGAAERQLAHDPGGAARSLHTVRALADQAMGDLRLLQLLLHDGPPDYAPQPGLGQLAELVARAGPRGASTRLAVAGDPDAVPPSIALSIHRIVEAVLPGGVAEIEVVIGAAAVSVTIVPAAVLRPGAALERVRLHRGQLEREPPDRLRLTLPL